MGVGGGHAGDTVGWLRQRQWGPVVTRSDPSLTFAVTFDLSGPGSPPALLPGFGNAPPWGPERANQNEEEPQRAVGDWRRGEMENVNNKIKRKEKTSLFKVKIYS